MAITNLRKYLEGFITHIAEERGVDCWFNESFVRDELNKVVKDEAWITLSGPTRIWEILEVCKVLSRKGVLTPQKRRQNSIFYAKAGVKLRTLKQKK